MATPHLRVGSFFVCLFYAAAVETACDGGRRGSALPIGGKHRRDLLGAFGGKMKEVERRLRYLDHLISPVERHRVEYLAAAAAAHHGELCACAVG